MAAPTHEHADTRNGTEPPRHAPAADLTRPSSTIPASAAPADHVHRTMAEPVPVGHAPHRERLSRRRVTALQRAAGNRAVSGLLRHVVQRVQVVEPPSTETLYNEEDASGKATANEYGGQAKYEMTREGDSGVTVTVKMSFVSQSRNTTDPNDPAAPPGTPELGALIGSPTEIPVDDPRRAWATNVVQEAVKIWNGRLTFVGEEERPGEPDPVAGVGEPVVTPKRLPVTFRAEPVFGLGDPYHNRIVVHPPSTVAGTPGHPIDAGNYYMNKGTSYEGDDNVITAHEYGHLLGLDDEYSQSNEQLNALLHGAAPANAPSLGKALDRATVERMVLASIRMPMVRQLARVMPQVTAAVRAQQVQVTRKMADAAKEGVVAESVRSQLTDLLTERSAGGVASDVPAAVAFQTTTNFSNLSHAGAAVGSVFGARALRNQLITAYWNAFGAAEGQNITLGGLGEVSIEVHAAVTDTTGSGGANAASASGLAASNVGATAARGGGPGGGTPASGGGAPGLPTITPPATLVDRLTALPGTWTAAGGAVETAITPSAFAAKMAATFGAARVVRAVASLVTAPDIGSVGRLYREAHALVSNAARTAATELAQELVTTTMTPPLDANVADLQSSIRTEVGRVMGTPASGIRALGTPDPNMTALVNAMKSRLDADKVAAAGGGRNPIASGNAPAQDVTYSQQGLMGSSRTTALRPDQFQPMVKQFNDNLKTEFEKPFTPEAR